MTRTKRGPCGDGAHPLVDANGERWEFAFQSFCNSYDLLTFGMVTKRLPAVLGGGFGGKSALANLFTGET